MTDERWEQIIDLIKQNYQIKEIDKGYLPEIENATYEFVVFECPLGKFKITRKKRHRVIDRKTHFSNRIGSDVKVDYVYSMNEFIDNLEVLKWDEMVQDWQVAKFDL